MDGPRNLLERYGLEPLKYQLVCLVFFSGGLVISYNNSGYLKAAPLNDKNKHSSCGLTVLFKLEDFEHWRSWDDFCLSWENWYAKAFNGKKKKLLIDKLIEGCF